MKTPTRTLKKVYQHYSENDWAIIKLDLENNILSVNQTAKNHWPLDDIQTNIKSAMPILATESLNQDFYIPFYNHNNQVFDVHFVVESASKYIFMVPTNKLHQQIQYKQQNAHEQAIEKLQLQYLLSALEGAHTELKAANQVKSFYISAMSHEIGNPLNVIKGYNQLLKEGSIETHKAAQIISRNIKKLEHIIDQSINYDKQQTKQFSALIKPALLINEQFNDFKIQAKNKNISFVNNIDKNLILASHKGKWNQIFSNLISNAIKYTESGHVKVCSEVVEGQLHIDVSDTGCGMSNEFQQELFTAWSREQKNQAQGNGIGLMISKMLAEQVDAQLTLRSSNSQGSCFRFSIKYAVPQQSQKILLVDDDPDCLNLFKHFLSDAGHHVKTATSIKDLQHQLAQNEFDVLISDLNLTDGQVHHAYPKFCHLVDKTIIMTASLDQQTKLKLETLGVKQVLSKPLTQEQLVNSVT